MRQKSAHSFGEALRYSSLWICDGLDLGHGFDARELGLKCLISLVPCGLVDYDLNHDRLPWHCHGQTTKLCVGQWRGRAKGEYDRGGWLLGVQRLEIGHA